MLSFFEGYELYSQKLIGEGVVTQSDCNAIWDEYQNICEQAHSLCLKETTIKVVIISCFVCLTDVRNLV